MPNTTRTLAGRQVKPIGFGCMSLSWGYGTRPSDAESARVLERAVELGYDHLDTARIYGLGHNETLIGNTLKRHRDKFLLASKTGIIVDGDKRRIDCRPETIRTALETSLQLLQTDHIDLYYLHRRDFTVPIEDSVGALGDLVREGKIGAIGLSEMSADTLRKAAAVHPIAAMQTEYSPMTRNPEIAVLDACRDVGTTFVSFSPVGRGLLADPALDMAALPAGDLRHGMPRFVGDNLAANQALVAAFAGIAKQAGVTPAQLALAWVLARAPHVVTIPGTSRIDHLEENFARWEWVIPADVSAAVDGLINEQTVAGGRYAEAMQRTIDTEQFEDA
ncbi:aldo/keto reductase [Novosphingobium lentum]|uniref:aldo/keto reductase n=1 Tax=Novosphingobium lentum TaxID=145287 RepID=UPI0008314153|nr:aldo/keto reductase [Novosphingobium lentum]